MRQVLAMRQVSGGSSGGGGSGSSGASSGDGGDDDVDADDGDDDDDHIMVMIIITRRCENIILSLDDMMAYECACLRCVIKRNAVGCVGAGASGWVSCA